MNHGSKFVYMGDDDYESFSDREVDDMWRSDDEEKEKAALSLDSDEDGDFMATESAPAPAATPAKKVGFFSLFFSRSSSSGAGASSSSSSTTTASTTSTSAVGGDGKKEDRREEKKEESNKKKKKAKARTNIVSINLGSLGETCKIATGDPIYCSNCKSGLNIHSKLEGETEEKKWKCEFCDTVNEITLSEEEIPTDETMDYLVEPSPEAANVDQDESNVIFCLDISGSMCVTSEVDGKFTLKGDKSSSLSKLNTERVSQRLPGEKKNVTYISRLQCLQAAVESSIAKLVADSPKKKVGLVTFNREVTLFGDGSLAEPHIITGDKLYDYDALIRTGEEAISTVNEHIKKSQSNLLNKVYSLEENGPTALGPAVAISVAIASCKPGSTVIVCTDGKANVGLGSLDVKGEEAIAEVDEWYKKVGHFAAEKGVTINVISIRGDDCRMEYLGALAEASGGRVNIVDPLKITTEFSNILSQSVIATNASCTVRLHKGMRFVGEEGVVTENNVIVRDVGNVLPSTELTFEYVVTKEAKHLTAIPFQVEIKYQKLDLSKMTRIITQVQNPTEDKKQAEEQLNVAVVATHVAQKSAQLAQDGEYGKARLLNAANARMFKRAVKDESKKSVVSKWTKATAALDKEIKTAKQAEKSEMGRNYSDDEEDEEEVQDLRSFQEKSKKRMEKKMGRKQKRDDSYSNQIYQFKSASTNYWK